MIYDYDNKKIAAYVKAHKMSARKAQIALNMTNVKALNGWMNGGDLRVSNLLHFVNTFRLNLLDFFTADGKPLSEQNQESRQTDQQDNLASAKQMQSESSNIANIATSNTDISQLVIKHIQEIANLRQKHVVEMAEKEKSLLLREMQQEKVIRQEYDAKLEATVTRMEERYERRLSEMQASAEKRFEQKLSEKDALIEELRQQLTELTLQYREQETVSKGVRPYQSTTMASDNVPQPFQKR